MMVTMKAVIFDMDGVLIDSEPLHYRLEKAMFAERGLTISESEHKTDLRFLTVSGCHPPLKVAALPF